jgi:7-carboxy-7-deazaguanine synthase
MLLVNEIYRGILGESRDAGTPCTIVRLTGCHRRCSYCDTTHAFTAGRDMSSSDVFTEIARSGSTTVLITGGEPLLQAEVLPLMERLVASGRQVILETSGTKGALALAEVPAPVRKVVDVKTPGSGIPPDQIDWEGIAGLGPQDDLKFVCCDRRDYEWARRLVLTERRIPKGPAVLFSPAHGCLQPAQLAEWILADGLQVRLQVQLHRLLWPDRERGI